MEEIRMHFKKPSSTGECELSGRCVHVCAGVHDMLQLKKTLLWISQYFQKELQDKLAALRAAGEQNNKEKLLGNPKDMESVVNFIFWLSWLGWTWRKVLQLRRKHKIGNIFTQKNNINNVVFIFVPEGDSFPPWWPKCGLNVMGWNI